MLVACARGLLDRDRPLHVGVDNAHEVQHRAAGSSDPAILGELSGRVDDRVTLRLRRAPLSQPFFPACTGFTWIWPSWNLCQPAAVPQIPPGKQCLNSFSEFGSD